MFFFIYFNDYPFFFIQYRIGKDNRPFKIIKFRTMHHMKDEACNIFQPGGRDRITRLGCHLRKLKLDELPQLINILKGEMSFVGPRPEVEKWVNAYPERWNKVLTVKPGLTDNASILFRNEEEILANSPDPEKTYREEILPKKLDLYEEYVDKHSFLGDLKIIGRTIHCVLFK